MLRNDRARGPRPKGAVWPLIGKVFAACAAGAGIALLYRMGLADIGGVLILSAIIISVITFVRSGALLATRLKGRDPRSIIRLGYLEVAKAFACAGAGVDLFRGLLAGVSDGVIPEGLITEAIVLAVAVVSAMGAGLFLVRAFATFLFVRRR
jgi:hypothetical protein